MIDIYKILFINILVSGIWVTSCAQESIPIIAEDGLAKVSKDSIVAINRENIESLSIDSLLFGKLSYTEKHFKSYDKDPNASAVVLHEKGNLFFEVSDGLPYILKGYHTKIKIIDKRGFKHANITIPLVGDKDLHEDVLYVRAVTHNNGQKTFLDEEEIYPSNSLDGGVELKFTLPKVQEGSVIEYRYIIKSPFIFKLDDWHFQGEIPKLYSEFNASIPSNYDYNRTLIGNQELCTNQVIYKDCYFAYGNSFSFLCETIQYAMEDIPAFNFEEVYMLGPSNYISRLDFELSKYGSLNYGTKFTTSWEVIDKEFKKDKNIGKQLRYKGFFGRKIPENLLNGNDEMSKAINIYNFIRNHYSWNTGYGIYGEARVKEAFNKKSGNVAEINMSLINLLNSAGITSNLVMMSTRDLGLPKKTYPVMSDFNYIIAKAKINGKEYLLDATDKFHPFGMLPLRALNHYGRVMDFKEESYWYDIAPYSNNIINIRATASINTEEEYVNGKMNILNLGYNAISLNELRSENNYEEYLNLITTEYNENLEMVSHKFIEDRSDELRVAEQMEVRSSVLKSKDKLFFNPFLTKFFKVNPFQTEERNNPIDFGYPRSFKYYINIVIPEGYKIHELPEKQLVQLGEKMAELRFYHKETYQQVAISFELSLNKSYFEAADYEGLKKVFKHVNDIQRNALVVLKKM